MTKKCDVSIVIPVYNEEENVGILYKELKTVLEYMHIQYEILFVDDGSIDDSFKIMENMAMNDSAVKIVKLLSNYGQSNAIGAGLKYAKGDSIITMDSDLQHDPDDIPRLLKKLDEGYHVVCGWRKHRSKADSLFGKTIPSHIFNFLTTRLTGLKNLHDIAGGMRALKRDIVESIELYGEMHRYLPALATWRGFKVAEEEITIRKRKYGTTKYGIRRLFRGFLDLITVKFLISYSTRPLHLFGGMGFFSFALGFLFGLYLLIQKFLFHVSLLEQHLPLLLLLVLLMIIGVNLISLGLMADMLSLYKKKEEYIVEKIVTTEK